MVEYNPTWDITDSSKLESYIRCPRAFFYRYILGWDLDIPAQDLWFGESWHRGREYQLLNGYDDVQGAYDKFITGYREKYVPEQDEYYSPKTPTAALNGYMAFAQQRSRDLIDNEVVVLNGQKMTEIAGTVPISDKRVLHYRMDSIIRRKEDGKIFSWDHKTTSEKNIKYDSWSNQFFLSLQCGTYTHCLYCMFPIEEVLGMVFCGIGFVYLKRGSAYRAAGYHCELKRVPAYKTPDQMNAWLWTVNDIMDNMERDRARLEDAKEDDPVLTAYPMNNTSCGAFRGCPYHDFCISWPNPLRNAYEPPLGFVKKFWDPSKIVHSVKRDLNMEGK